MLTPEQLDAYAAVLTTLARFQLKVPDDETLSVFGQLIDEWPLPETEATTTGLNTLRQSAKDEETSRNIKTDHNWLYGVSATAKVSPYESVHRDRDHLVFDEQTLKVRQAYRQLSLQAPRLNREPDDHIGLEMEFLGLCLLRAIEAEEAGTDSAQYLQLARDFMDEHVNEWAPEMLSKAAEQADTQFMKGLCLTSLAVLQDLDQNL